MEKDIVIEVLESVCDTLLMVQSTSGREGHLQDQILRIRNLLTALTKQEKKVPCGSCDGYAVACFEELNKPLANKAICGKCGAVRKRGWVSGWEKS